MPLKKAFESANTTMITKANSQLSLGVQSRPVFRDMLEVKRLILPSKMLFQGSSQLTSLNTPDLFGKPKDLPRLGYLLAKLFMAKRVSMAEAQALSPVEKRLFLMIMNKKKEASYRQSALDEQCLANANKFWAERRIEENIRFLVKKILKFLQSVFREKLLNKVEICLLPQYSRLSKGVRFDYSFFGYYFADVKSLIDRPIESFFHPRSRAHPILKANKNIPRTISQEYLGKLKASALFVRDLKAYLDRHLMAEIQSDILKKIQKMILRWQKMLGKASSTEFLEVMKRQLSENPKFKLPWSFQEVFLAVQKIFQVLGIRRNIG